MLLKVIKVRADECSFYLFFLMIGFIFGNILLAGLTFLDAMDNTIFPLGSILALSVGIMIPVIMGIFNLTQLFSLEVSFGVSRKRFFIYDVLVSLMINAVMAVMVIVLNIVEIEAHKLLYSSYQQDSYVLFYKLIPWFVMGVIGVTVLREFVGALILKFGQKAYVVIWVSTMMIGLILQRIANYAHEHKSGMIVDLYNSISDFFLNMDMAGYAIIGAVFTIVTLGISWLIIRKQAVKA